MPKSPELKSLEEVSSSPETSQEQKQEFSVLHFVDQEAEVLEGEVAKSKTPKKAQKKAGILAALTLAGALWISSVPGLAHAEGKAGSGQRQTEAQTAGDIQTLEQQIEALKAKQQQLVEKERKEEAKKREVELNSWLGFFGVKGLTVGSPEVMAKTYRMEQLGIYLTKEGKEKQHLGDICSQGRQFGKVEFINSVSKILEEHDIKFKLKQEVKDEIELKVNFPADAQELLKGWGGNWDPEKKSISFGEHRDGIDFDETAISIAIVKVDSEMLIISCINADGSRNVVPCVNGAYNEKDIITLKAVKGGTK